MSIWSRIKRPFIIKTRLEASFIVYALGLGAAERGKDYLIQFPGKFGWVMFSACMLAVLMGGAKIFDAITLEKQAEAE
jgi:hypothetical protein